MRLSHVNARGEVRMVDVGAKPVTRRVAVAEAAVCLNDKALKLLRSGSSAKGDVLATARIAAIQAGKRTSELIPLCHAVPLDDLQLAVAWTEDGVVLQCTASATARTGVEMEALTAVSVGALTLYDMLKAVDRTITFEVRLCAKEGGRSGSFSRAK